jgi:hypothetical protein
MPGNRRSLIAVITTLNEQVKILQGQDPAAQHLGGRGARGVVAGVLRGRDSGQIGTRIGGKGAVVPVLGNRPVAQPAQQLVDRIQQVRGQLVGRHGGSASYRICRDTAGQPVLGDRGHGVAGMPGRVIIEPEGPAGSTG